MIEAQTQEPGWCLTVTDTVTGAQATAQISQEQLCATLCLVIDNEGMPYNVDECYKVIGTLYDAWPINLRPIP